MKLGIRDTMDCFFTFKGLTSDNTAIGDYGILKENERIPKECRLANTVNIGWMKNEWVENQTRNTANCGFQP